MEELQNEAIIEDTEDKKKWCVYIHINKINDKVYVGQTCQDVNRRWRNGAGYQKYQAIRRAFDKYGWDNFEHIIVFDNLSLDEANRMECFLIDLFDAQNPEFGYNISGGGDNRGERNPNYGTHLSEELKRKLSQKAKERYRDPREREKLSIIFKGRQFSEEHKKHIKESKIGVYVGENNPNYGNGKPVIQLDLNYQFIAEHITICQASKITGIDDSQIIRCCKHKPKHKTAGGFIWMYKEEYEQQFKILNKDKKEK